MTGSAPSSPARRGRDPDRAAQAARADGAVRPGGPGRRRHGGVELRSCRRLLLRGRSEACRRGGVGARSASHDVVGRAGDRGDDRPPRRPRRRRTRRCCARAAARTMRSATARTSSMLWLTMMTPRPRSRSRSIRSSTSAVWATPSAAVGSSRMMSFGLAEQRAGDRHGLPLAARERRDGDPDRRDLRRQLAAAAPTSAISIATSSSRHGRARGPGRGSSTTSRFSHSARSWNTVAMPRSCAALGSGCVTVLAVEGDRAGVRPVHAGEHLHQRRLAGAVVADERDHLAGVRRRGRRRSAPRPRRSLADIRAGSTARGRLPAFGGTWSSSLPVQPPASGGSVGRRAAAY